MVKHTMWSALRPRDTSLTHGEDIKRLPSSPILTVRAVQQCMYVVQCPAADAGTEQLSTLVPVKAIKVGQLRTSSQGVGVTFVHGWRTHCRVIQQFIFIISFTQAVRVWLGRQQLQAETMMIVCRHDHALLQCRRIRIAFFLITSLSGHLHTSCAPVARVWLGSSTASLHKTTMIVRRYGHKTHRWKRKRSGGALSVHLHHVTHTSCSRVTGSSTAWL